jgi:hypothetical protein
MEDKNLDRLNKATKIQPHELSEAVITDATAKAPARNWAAISSVAAAAVLVTALGVGQLSPKAPLIQLSAGNTQSESSLKMGTGAADGSATKDMMMRAPIEYQASNALSTDATKGHVFELKVVGDAQSIARTVAEALNFSGTEKYESEWDSATIEGKKDASGYPLESLYATGKGTGNWSYWNGSNVYSDEKVVVPVTDAQARAQAATIFTATGLNVSTSDVKVTRDDFGLSATADMMINEMSSGLVWSIHWNGEGEIDSAWGHSVELVDRGEFGNVSPASAVERLSKYGYWAGVSDSFYTQVANKDFSYDSAEVMVVTDSKLTNGLVFDAKGNAWLVPSYALSSADYGFQGSVIALNDGIIELPKEQEIMPMDSEVSTR